MFGLWIVYADEKSETSESRGENTGAFGRGTNDVGARLLRSWLPAERRRPLTSGAYLRARRSRESRWSHHLYLRDFLTRAVVECNHIALKESVDGPS